MGRNGNILIQGARLGECLGTSLDGLSMGELTCSLESAVTKKWPRKPFRMCSYKIIGLKVVWNEYLQKNRGGGSVPSRPASLAGLGFKSGFPKVCLAGSEESRHTGCAVPHSQWQSVSGFLED